MSMWEANIISLSRLPYGDKLSTRGVTCNAKEDEAQPGVLILTISKESWPESISAALAVQYLSSALQDVTLRIPRIGFVTVALKLAGAGYSPDMRLAQQKETRHDSQSAHKVDGSARRVSPEPEEQLSKRHAEEKAILEASARVMKRSAVGQYMDVGWRLLIERCVIGGGRGQQRLMMQKNDAQTKRLAG